MKISAIVLTKNEEDNIEKCLKRLTFCDEIIVIDDNSTDDTAVLAKNIGAKVYSRSLNGDFASQRNFGLEKAKSEWVLFIDADEIVTPSLREEIKQMGNEQIYKYSGFYIKRQDFFLGKTLKYGEAGNIKLLRFARKGKARWKRKVHEYWDIDGKTKTLENPLVHNSHPNLKQLINSLDSWSNLHALENKSEGKSSNLLKIITFPSAHFVKNYFFKKGFLDGVHGFTFAIFISFHSFLSWSKLWLNQKKD